MLHLDFYDNLRCLEVIDVGGCCAGIHNVKLLLLPVDPLPRFHLSVLGDRPEDILFLLEVERSIQLRNKVLGIQLHNVISPIPQRQVPKYRDAILQIRHTNHCACTMTPVTNWRAIYRTFNSLSMHLRQRSIQDLVPSSPQDHVLSHDVPQSVYSLESIFIALRDILLATQNVNQMLRIRIEA
jgi:hypothetical protein